MDVILTIIFALFFLILFPLGELARIDFPNNIALTGIDIGVVSIALLGGILIFTRKKNNSYSLGKPIAIFLGVCLLSLVVNIVTIKQNELLVAFLYLLRFAAYASLYFVVRSLPEFIKKWVVVCMLLGGGLILLGGYMQFFFYPSLRNLYYLGWDVHLYRMFSSFLDPNFLGAFLVLFLLFLFALIFSKNIKKSKFLSIVSLILIAGTGIGIMLTYSRSAYVMCVVGIATYFILQKPSKKIMYAIVTLFIIAIVGYFGVTRYSEGTNLFRTTSSVARIATSANAVIIFQKNPALGVGFNAYRSAQNRYGLIKHTPSDVAIDHSGAGTDNSFLFILATTGIVGFIAYMFLLWKICMIAKQHLRKTIFAPVIISSIVALCVDAFFINSWFYPFIMIWMWVLVGLEEGVDKDFFVE